MVFLLFLLSPDPERGKWEMEICPAQKEDLPWLLLRDVHISAEELAWRT